MEVTATAVRQRLTRLLAQGDIERATERVSRGRPVHRYGLTEKGRRRAGANFADLAIALWQEIREIKDPEVRRGLLAADQRADGRRCMPAQIHGSTLEERMESLAELFRERQIPFEVERHERVAGAARDRLPVSRIGRAGSDGLLDGADDVFGVARRERAAEQLPAGWPQLLHV